MISTAYVLFLTHSQYAKMKWIRFRLALSIVLIREPFSGMYYNFDRASGEVILSYTDEHKSYKLLEAIIDYNNFL